jgi:tetratricopeptide (TPR) repeat protein
MGADLRSPGVYFVLASWVVVALGSSTLPLARDLGFERAFLAGLWAPVAGAVLGAALVRARQDGRACSGWNALFGWGLALHGLGLLPSLAAGAWVEAWTVRCDSGVGGTFFLLLPGVGGALGLAIGMVARGGFGRGWGAVFAGLVLLDLGSVVLHLYREPQVFAFSPLFGWWPGSLYDEAIAPTAALWIHRSAVFIGAVGIAVGAGSLQTAPGRLGRWPVRDRAAAGIGASLCLVAGAVLLSGDRWGFRTGRATIQAELDTRVESEHFVLHLPHGTSETAAQQVRFDHEFHYQRLREWFGTEPAGRIHSYVYPDAQTKGRLLGAARTQIARPWAAEIHIQGVRSRHPSLGHELAHVFAAGWARGVLAVPARAGVWVNMGLVEGVAEAAELPAGPLSHHQAAAALVELGQAPPITAIMSPAGFWSRASGRAYTVAGSFVRWLRDTHGVPALRRAYREASFDHLPGGLAGAEKDWQAWLQRTVKLSARMRRTAAHRYRRRSIFQRTCPHLTADLRRRATTEMQRGDLTAARTLLDRAFGYHPDPTSYLGLVRRYDRAGQAKEARQLLARTRTATVPDRTGLDEAQALLAWRAGDTERARQIFDRARREWTRFSQLRANEARLWALTHTASTSDALRAYLGGELAGERALWTLVELSATGSPLVDYLLGRRLVSLREPAARGRLEPLLARDDLPPGLRWETHLLLGRLAVHQGDHDRAKRHFDRVVGGGAPFEARAEALQRTMRLQFMESWSGRPFDVTSDGS